MADRSDSPLAPSDLPEIVRRIRARTPARLLTGRAGAAYRTSTQIELREAHAAARDAVRTELDLSKVFGADWLARWQAFEVRTRANSREEYLLRPDLGRRLDDRSRAEIQQRCPRGSDLQIVIGDGLSVPAVQAQVPPLMPLLGTGAEARRWQMGRAFVIRHCRVGVLNEMGELLDPKVVVLLIGERPGLATAESLSAYMAYQPRASHSDRDRNLVSNIHARGLSAEAAAARILDFAAEMMRARRSGGTLGAQGPALEAGSEAKRSGLEDPSYS
ncbi:MAG TPA: ethanolamine ammonia-lyase subunit EutC [Candidatus Acidoferrales bacterium]|nr:ethanolamine ammonia-lyase subunit EutC [Candidatus Acidoferrales bacterium]